MIRNQTCTQMKLPLIFKGLAILSLVFQGCAGVPPKKAVSPANSESKVGSKEKHFKSLRQLTFDGTNAEAYFSPDGKKLIFQGRASQSNLDPNAKKCDQIYTMNVDGSDKRLISTKGGRNTCSYFINQDRVLFSSTFEAGENCPTERDRSKGYVWEIFKSYDIYSAKPDGSDLRPLTRTLNYDAEATVCRDKIVFTSAREGNALHVYTMNTDGSNVKKLTDELGYNGGPFFSPDCSQIVYRAYHPYKKREIKRFKSAVSEGYIPPGPLDLFVMKADGSEKIQLTDMRTASFAPSFYPKGDRVIFSSTISSSSSEPEQRSIKKRMSDDSKQGHRAFQLWSVNSKKAMQIVSDSEQITFEGSFNGFPMFSPDGKYLVFASNRNSSNPHELNVFIAEWQD